MKSFYILAAALAILLFVNDASAQYFAVRSGNWNDDGPASVWAPNGKPPALCNSCTITINSGVTVSLNTSVTLTGNSLVNIGSGGINAALLLIPAATTQTDIASGNNLILINDGSTPGSQVTLGNSSSSLSASGAGKYDGVFIALSTAPITYLKQIGTAPSIFSGTLIAGGPATFGMSLTGPVTLTAGSILPIILTDFTAELNKSQVELNWQTSLEENSDHFAIQRLDLATGWETIGRVDAQGNSSLPVQYSFTDQNPHSGVNNYRLESVDRDGKVAFSEIKAVTLGAVDAKIFPNPASDYVNVNLSGSAAGTQSVRLYNQSGQLLMEKKVDNGAGTIVSLPVTNYPQGNYVIIVTGPDGSRQVSKLFISRL